MLELSKKLIRSQIVTLKEELAGLGEGDTDRIKKHTIIKSLRDLKKAWLELKAASVVNHDAEELEELANATMELEQTLGDPALARKKVPKISNMKVQDIEALDDVEVPLLGFDSVPD